MRNGSSVSAVALENALPFFKPVLVVVVFAAVRELHAKEIALGVSSERALVMAL